MPSPPAKNHTILRTIVTPQLLLFVLTLAIWLIRPIPAFWAPILAYALAWLLLDRLRLRLPALPNTRAAVLAVGALVLVAIAPVAELARARSAFADSEGLVGLDLQLEDRLRLEKRPAIAPSVIFDDHPQTLYLHAPGAQEVSLRLAPDLPNLEATNLGHGVFRVAFDPRTDPLPQVAPQAGDSSVVQAIVTVDGREHRRPLSRVSPLAHPRWFASAPAHGLAATVSEETDELFLLDREGLVASLVVADGPTDVVFVDDGSRLVVAHRYTPELWVIDVASQTVEARLPGAYFQTRLAASPSGTAVAVAVADTSPRIEIVDLRAARQAPDEAAAHRQILPLDTPADWLAYGPTDDLLVIASRADRALRRAERLGTETAAPWRVTGMLPLGRPAATLGRSPDGRIVWVATSDYRPDGEPHRGNHFIQDQLLTVDVGAWQVVDQRLTARRTPDQDEPGNVSSGTSPIGIVGRDDGSVLVAFAGSEEVWSLPPGARSPDHVVAGFDLDLISPVGVADLGDGFWAASSPAGGAVAIYGPTMEMVTFIGLTPPDDDLAAGAPRSLDRHALSVRAGERAFNEATRAGISCQSCHLHADTDESPHDIGQNPLLPTLTVRGTHGTAPYLRDGSFPRIRDLDSHLAGGLYRGYVRFLEGRGEVLETYVASLPRTVNPRNFAPRDLERERAGLDAFVRARCALCHVPPAFTNLSQHPVELLFPTYAEGLPPGSQVDTPSLLASHTRSHFLQDGRAHDLDEVLVEFNVANQHGDAESLTADERAALIAFLLAL